MEKGLTAEELGLSHFDLSDDSLSLLARWGTGKLLHVPKCAPQRDSRFKVQTHIAICILMLV